MRSTLLLIVCSSCHVPHDDRADVRFVRETLHAFASDEIARSSQSTHWSDRWRHRSPDFESRVRTLVRQSYSWPASRRRALLEFLHECPDGVALCVAAALLMANRDTEAVLALHSEGMNPSRSSCAREWLLEMARSTLLTWGGIRVRADGSIVDPAADSGRTVRWADVREHGLARASALQYRRFRDENRDDPMWGKAGQGGLGLAEALTAGYLSVGMSLQDYDILAPVFRDEIRRHGARGLLLEAFEAAVGRTFSDNWRGALTFWKRYRASNPSDRQRLMRQPLIDAGIEPDQPASAKSRQAFLALLENERLGPVSQFAARWFNQQYRVRFDLGIVFGAGGSGFLTPSLSLFLAPGEDELEVLRSFWKDIFLRYRTVTKAHASATSIAFRGDSFLEAR